MLFQTHARCEVGLQIRPPEFHITCGTPIPIQTLRLVFNVLCHVLLKLQNSCIVRLNAGILNYDAIIINLYNTLDNNMTISISLNPPIRGRTHRSWSRLFSCRIHVGFVKPLTTNPTSVHARLRKRFTFSNFAPCLTSLRWGQGGGCTIGAPKNVFC